MVPYPLTLNDPNLDLKVMMLYLFMPIDALSALCAQLTRDLLAIAEFLSCQYSFIFSVYLRCCQFTVSRCTLTFSSCHMLSSL